ncbi:metallophosphoesterase family protein [Dictyobacter aurantiacus]|uniref:Phosphoesterase n=1 Tax=Dictyobacter aurantiacus TaxID=1936993 RepID=A0A401ZFC0_9CHLR|nr:metallophosphoesterase family protein [Dictyobacter aurantiacus]GCE05574.1 phosphoesterase [Dictyobacter aurantiacus]
MQHRIGVISDTHCPRFPRVPEAVWKHFAGVELIIHAGDLSTLSVISDLETIAPVVAVQGNVEQEEVVMTLPIKKEIRVGGMRIGIVHILGDARSYARTARQEFPEARVVIFGHSHNPYNQEHAGQLLFNPGSANDRRRQPACSIGQLLIDDEAQAVKGELILLP